MNACSARCGFCGRCSDDDEGTYSVYPECEEPGCTNRVASRTDVFCLDCQQQQHRDINEQTFKAYIRKFFKETA